MEGQAAEENMKWETYRPNSGRKTNKGQKQDDKQMYRADTSIKMLTVA
jgi:hypothetical protein